MPKKLTPGKAVSAQQVQNRKIKKQEARIIDNQCPTCNASNPHMSNEDQVRSCASCDSIIPPYFTMNKELVGRKDPWNFV